jgi:hypothetical protein
VSEPVHKQLERAQDFLRAIPGAADKAIAATLNRAATAGRETAIDAIGERYVVHAGDVRERITTTPARPDALSASVVARSGPLALAYFPHSPVAAGTGGAGKPVLRAEVIRGQQRAVPGAFVAPINGRPRIMIRTGGKTRTGRSAIKTVSTVPIANMLGAESVRQAVEASTVAIFEQNLDREIDRALGKAS